MGQVGNNYLAATGLLMMAAEPITTRPTRDLLLQLPLLPTTSDHRIDYDAADPASLVQLAENAETVMNTINMGLSAVGTILAHAASEVGSEIGGDTIEALGWFIAETSDVSAALLSLVMACRHHTADYAPPKSQRTPMTRF